MVRGAGLVELDLTTVQKFRDRQFDLGLVETSVALDAQLPLDQPEMETK